MRLCLIAITLAAFVQSSRAKGPFLNTLSDTEHVIGNDLWNVTIGRTYGTKLFYKNHDCVGSAAGHYVSYS